MADRDVLDVDAGVVEGAHREGQDAGSPGGVDRAALGLDVDRRCADVQPFEHAGGASEGGGFAGVEVEHVRAHSLFELGRRSLSHDPAAVDDDDEGGEMVGFVEVLSGEQDVGALCAQSADGVPQLDAAAGVEAGCRLVEEEQARRAHQARPEVEAPAHPARVGLHQAVPRLGEAESIEGGGAGGACRAPGLAVEPGHHGEVLPAGHHLLHRRGLTGQSDHAAHGLRLADHVVAGHHE